MKSRLVQPDNCPVCISLDGRCFARCAGKCTVLVSTRGIAQCTFKKPKRLVTRGVRYSDERDYQFHRKGEDVR